MSNFDAGKVKKDIADLRDKKQTLLLSLQKDIEIINGEMMAEFCRIGQKAYELKNADFAALAEDFAKIDRFLASMDAKDKKKTEISDRYDDEITILEKLVPAQSASAFCMKCGKPYNAGTDSFCMSCGNKL